MCISNAKERIKKLCSRHVKKQEHDIHRDKEKQVIGTAFKRAQMLDLADYKSNIIIRFKNLKKNYVQRIKDGMTISHEIKISHKNIKNIVFFF